MGIIWEDSLPIFLFITIFLGGGAAYLTGRAVALTWRSLVKAALYVLLLTCSVRFVHYALFAGELFSIHFFIVDLVVLLAFAGLGFRRMRTRQMTGQYPWIFSPATLLSWKDKAP